MPHAKGPKKLQGYLGSVIKKAPWCCASAFTTSWLLKFFLGFSHVVAPVGGFPVATVQNDAHKGKWKPVKKRFGVHGIYCHARFNVWGWELVGPSTWELGVA